MAERMVTEANWGYHDFTLKTGVVAERGKLACIDTADGSLTKGGPETTLVPIGTFHNSLTGDGVKQVTVRLFYPIALYWWENDTAGTPVTAADLGQVVNIKDDQTVTLAAGSSLGLALQLDASKGVLVYSSYPFLPPPPAGP